MLKRTERLIDAVKLFDLLELLETQDAMLKMERMQDDWRVECEIEGRQILKKQSESLSNIVNDIMKILSGTTNIC